MLHLTALAAIWRLAPQPAPTLTQTPVELTLLRPPLEPPSLPNLPPPKKRRASPPRPKAEPSRPEPTGQRESEAPPAAPRSEETRPLVLPSFILPPPNSTDDGSDAPRAHGDDQLDEVTRVAQRIGEMVAEHDRRANAKQRGLDARTAQIAHGIQNAFEASVLAAKRETNRLNVPVLGRIVDDLLGGVEQHVRDVEARNHPDPTLPTAGEVGVSTAGVDQPDGTQNTKNERKPHPDLPMICLGACATGSHEHRRLSTTIDLEHDPRGVPSQWRIAQSSGSVPFDDGALRSVELALGCMRENGHHVLFCRPLAQSALGPVPRRSRWVLHGIVRRWSHLERILDPHFEPAGRYIGAGPFSGNYLESAVELTELAYWDVASQPARARK